MLLLLVVLLAGVLRYLAAFQEKVRLAAPTISIFEVGQFVGDFTLPDIEGNSVASTSLIGRGQNTLLLLLSATCGSCQTLIEQVVELTRRTGGVRATGWHLVLVIVAEPGMVDDVVQQYPQLLSEGITVLQETKGEVLKQYGVTGVPTGLAIDGRGQLLDQTLNPHVNWLYKTLRVPAPKESLTPEWQGTRSPVIEVPV
jgi:cytochrome oxidase Cu insertion factor (SCO1/SenC/PrrC family)